ncbi:MAG: bifunctional riboflavin kinase/FAD synthetase [Candidatus Hydrogenedentota bacterium]|nr:MAG: bifunctional riboflavin kinase/FAD synthetase [Candidatus Hydrogenedentota bacterium]
MEIISDLTGFTAKWGPAVLTLGDFDGLHRGHRKLIERNIRTAKKQGYAPVLVTYEPSPKKVLGKLRSYQRIYTKEEKIIILQQFDLRAAVFIPFTEELAKTPAHRFLKEILLEKLLARHIILGYDHHFGRNRHGHYHYLKKAAHKYGFSVEQMKPVLYKRKVISSTRIRECLSEGKLADANAMLGDPFLIRGPVIRGKGRGKQIGIPTINISLAEDKMVPKAGVYFGIAKYGGEYYRALMNVGFNPTFANVNLSVEAHLLNFNKEIYGETVRLYFLRRLRDEKKFPSVEKLVNQIHKDIEKGRKLKVKGFSVSV